MEELAAFEPTPLPLVSLYINLSPDQHGRDSYEPFLRKAFGERAKAFQPNSSERQSFERDTQRIWDYLGNEVNRSSNGLAIFACAGADDYFETIPFDAPIGDHWLFIGSVPHRI